MSKNNNNTPKNKGTRRGQSINHIWRNLWYVQYTYITNYLSFPNHNIPVSQKFLFNFYIFIDILERISSIYSSISNISGLEPATSRPKRTALTHRTTEVGSLLFLNNCRISTYWFYKQFQTITTLQRRSFVKLFS